MHYTINIGAIGNGLEMENGIHFSIPLRWCFGIVMTHIFGILFISNFGVKNHGDKMAAMTPRIYHVHATWNIRLSENVL